MAQDIPIDIHIPKLLEWLVSRRHCNNSWQAQMQPIREKINSAIQDMPENKEITELLSGTYINYFHCCRIVDILRETEADTKNVFGMYGSQRMKDWQEIVRLYQKENVYLAEAASLLLRFVKYEVPNVKKQISKCKQIQLDCDKKISEYTKSILFAERELELTKKQLDITGNDIRAELLKQVSRLDDIHNNVILNIKALEKPFKYYSTFSQFVANETYLLPLISYVIEKGNTTTYEYLYGEPPQKVELINHTSVNDTNKDEYTEEINWDLSDVNETDYNYDACSSEESGIEVEPAPTENNIAKGNEAFTVLDNPKLRNEFVAQLLELQSFFKMRLLEIQKENGSLSLMNEELQESSESILKMLDSVQVVKQLMTDPSVQQLHFIKHSNRYVDKMATLFNQKVSTIKKLIASEEVIKTKKEETKVNETELKPKLKLIIDKTRQLQEEIKQDISKKYKNRPVNLIGGF